jgi:hypothetical protein
VEPFPPQPPATIQGGTGEPHSTEASGLFKGLAAPPIPIGVDVYGRLPDTNSIGSRIDGGEGNL